MGTRGRQAVFLYLLTGSLSLQAAFVVESMGVPLDVHLMQWCVLLVAPLLVITTAMVAGPAPEAPDDWLRWMRRGFTIFGLWAGCYFAMGELNPGRWRVLEPSWADRLFPLLPAASLVYLCVHPLFLLPFVRLDSPSALQRLLRGDAGIVLVSVACWAAFPVTLPRPSLGEGAGFGVWVLRTIWATDPPTNCLPSTHCAMALHAALALWERPGMLGRWAMASAIAIGLSTLATHQHSLLDVLTGYALGGVMFLVVRRRLPEPLRPVEVRTHE